MTRIVFAILAVTLLNSPTRAADPIKIPFKVVDAAFKKAECTIELKDEGRTEVEELGGGLKLVEIYCWRAAYQAGSIFLAVDPKKPDKARLLRYQHWTSKGLTWVYSLTEPTYDPETKKLASAHKERGVGDCGTIGEWKWTGTEFRLINWWFKEACDGEPFNDDEKWHVYPPQR
jgi:Protein of unknown function (DUF1176)